MGITRTTISMPDEMKKDLLKLARAEKRSLSSYAQIIFENHLKGVAGETEQEPRQKMASKKRRAIGG